MNDDGAVSMTPKIIYLRQIRISRQVIRLRCFLIHTLVTTTRTRLHFTQVQIQLPQLERKPCTDAFIMQ